MEAWEGLHRQGQDLAHRFRSLAHDLSCLLHSHLQSSDIPPQPSGNSHPNRPFSWPSLIPGPQKRAQPHSNRVRFNHNRKDHSSIDHEIVVETAPTTQSSTGIQELGQRIGQVGTDFGACVSGLVGHVVQQFPRPFHGDSESLLLQPPSERPHKRSPGSEGYTEWREVDESATTRTKGSVSNGGRKSHNNSRRRRAEEVPQSEQESNELQDVSNEELFAFLTKSNEQFHKQGNVSVTTTFDSRTRELESSVVARGDLWRAEASHGGNASANGTLFLLQIGPILFVRDTTLLLPVHISKQHLLWYGFDRKNGLHSLCPAIWSKHRRWLLMSMICLNPFACSFMDLQFPNGQLTYVAGEGLTSSAFLLAFGGLIQAQSRQPGGTKLSYSCKTKWGTRISPSLQLPEKSLALGVVQPLAWQRSGLMVRPTIQLSITPTFGGRNMGWRAEVIHLPKEKLSWSLGCALSIQPSAFASLSLGKSKRNGGHSGASGLVFQVETPLENINRASFSIQLNSGVEF